MSDQEEKQPPVEIPVSSLSPDALAGVIKNFIVRDGTDYGQSEVSYEAKELSIRKQLDRGAIKIVFDTNEESVTLMTKLDFEQRFPK